MRSFTIVVERDGKVKVQTQGFKGPACLVEAQRLKEVLKALGLELETEELTLTEEYYETETVKQEGVVFA